MGSVDLGRGLLGAGAVGDQHPVPVGGQPLRAGAADAAGAAGDKRDLHRASLTQTLRCAPRPVMLASITSPGVQEAPVMHAVSGRRAGEDQISRAQRHER